MMIQHYFLKIQEVFFLFSRELHFVNFMIDYLDIFTTQFFSMRISE